MTVITQSKGKRKGESSGHSQIGGSNGSSGLTEIHSRGIVTMVNIKKRRAKGDVLEVNWNEMGQPIGTESMTLAHFIGSCGRRTFPITIDWQDKKFLPLKEQLWDEVKETFAGINESHKKVIISRAGNLHKAFRTRLRNLTRDSEGNYSDEPPSIYSHLSTVAPFWKDFVALSSTTKFKETSKTNKEKAENMDARYRGASVGYARMREKISEQRKLEGEEDPIVTCKDVWIHGRMNAEHKVDDPTALKVIENMDRLKQGLEEDELNVINDDVLLARAIPLEYSGRVRGYGWGVTKKSLARAPELSELAKLKKRCNQLETDMHEIKSKGYQPTAPLSSGSSHMDNFDAAAITDSDDDLDLSDESLDVVLPQVMRGYNLRWQ